MDTLIRTDLHASTGKRLGSAWDRAKEAFDESLEIARFGARFDDDGKPAVTYQRTNLSNFSSSAVWIKVYQKNKKLNLKPFADWELEILKLRTVKQAHKHVSQHLEAREKASPIGEIDHPDNSGFKEITTENKGPSVDDWRAWPLRAKGTRLEHLFMPAGNYLRFARAALTALEKLHDCGGLVHCDLHQGNWCMKPEHHHRPEQGEDRISLTINWDNVAIFDLGCSLHPGKTPPLPIPIDKSAASPHLDAAFESIKTKGDAALSAAGEQAWKTWSSFAEAAKDQVFWEKHAQTVMSPAYRKVDWREDYWKFGQLLWELRGGDAVSNAKAINAPTVNQSKSRERRAPNLLIGECESNLEDPDTKEMIFTPARGLAEDLIAWGDKQTHYDTDTTLNEQQRLNAAATLRRATHVALMHRLDEAINSLAPEDTVTKVFLYREDIDKAYADQEAGKKAWQSTEQQLAEEQRIKDQAEQAQQDKLAAEREAQRQANEAEEARLGQVAEEEERARDEAEQANLRQLAAAREAQRLADEAEEARLRQVAEENRLAEQAHQRQLEWEKEQESKANEKAAHEAEQARLLEAKRLADEARRERNARWRARLLTNVNGFKKELPAYLAILGLLGAGIGGAAAWGRWGEPVWRDQAKPTLSRWYDSAAERVRLATTTVVKPTDAGSAAPAANAAADAAKIAMKTARETAVDAAKATAASSARQAGLQADYAATAEKIGASAWWLKGGSQGIAPNAEQIAWATATVQHAKKDQWMQAQYVLGALHCSAAYPAVARHSSADCGRWMGQALANPAYGQDPVASQKLHKNVTTLFDDMVMGLANGKLHEDPPDYAFARALLPGLQARQGDSPALALRAAYTLACAAKPVQRAQAKQTLQGITQLKNATPAEATQAQNWLADWRAGDYSHCRPA